MYAYSLPQARHFKYLPGNLKQQNELNILTQLQRPLLLCVVKKEASILEVMIMTSVTTDGQPMQA